MQAPRMWWQGPEGGSGGPAALSEPGPSRQIRRYKANKEVMEKAAEVYTRLKSRVLGPKIEAIQKANKTGAEKEKAEAEKAEEKLAGEEAAEEKAEDEPSTGAGWWWLISMLAARGVEGALQNVPGTWGPQPCSATDWPLWCVPLRGLCRPALLSARQSGCGGRWRCRLCPTHMYLCLGEAARGRLCNGAWGCCRIRAQRVPPPWSRSPEEGQGPIASSLWTRKGSQPGPRRCAMTPLSPQISQPP